jgi:hypothetical protein
VDSLSWLWNGSDGPRMRRLRRWLKARGYARVGARREGVGRFETYVGRILAIQFWVDREIDWYLDLKPVDGSLDFRPIEPWTRCIGSTIDPGIRLSSLEEALRRHLAQFEAACEPARLPRTVTCLQTR